MIRIVKASAGSGKTYTLAHSYLDLLKTPDAYRHILAVTFTNKATAEMKARILQYLYEAWQNGEEEAGKTLKRILHDYSAFAVSTIDKFFQQALKAFARELGQMADYRIELDRPSLISEAMDRILDSLSADRTEILDALKRNVEDSLQKGTRPRLEEALYAAGSQLMNSEVRALAEKYGIDMRGAFGSDRLAAIRDSCDSIIKDFTLRVNEAAKLVEVKKNVSLRKLQPYLEGFRTWQVVPYPAATLAGEAEGSSFMELFDGPAFRWYNTALLLRSNTLCLAVAGDFFRSFDELLREKNIMCLEESNSLLKDIIAGSDAPFVYEKLGVRYEHFLLDEFQDTSILQWENFKPLLRESDASRHDNLIVGDVKQSIYRWRDSDWTLLGKRVLEDFPDASEKPLTGNYRSLRSIVEFNNGFFAEAAARIGRSDLYADVRQEVRRDESQPGYVRVSFCDKDERTAKIIDSISAAREAGARYGDIAILVRKKEQGNAVAAELLARDIPVISDDSLRLTTSVTLRKLAGLLAKHENTGDGICEELTSSLNVSFPESYHSLTDLCENLLLQLQESSPDSFREETPFIQAFMDQLREWVDVNGNELHYFLRYWDEKKGKLAVSSPEDADAIRIITVHSAKGLEFPYLIFPYAEDVKRFHSGDIRWCRLDAEGTPFAPEATGIYPVKLESAVDETLFSGALEEEKAMQDVDNINVFYVALTRAEKCLHVIANTPPAVFREAKGSPEYKDFSQMLYTYCGGLNEFVKGEMYDFTRMERSREDKAAIFPYTYRSIPVGGRLRAASDAADFFGEDGVTGAGASPRRNGLALHWILSQVNGPSELRAAVDAAVLDGQLGAEEGERAFELLSSRMASHGEWFSGAGLNEVTLFDAGGSEKRPDRVLVQDGRVLVIDYKFGESSPQNDSRYRRQVEGYMRIFRSLGYDDVSGAVWYVIPDTVLAL